MKDLDATERKIITALIDGALENKWRISVSDGEEYTVSRSTDRAAIRAAIGTTDETTLRFTTAREGDEGDEQRHGTIWLVHGNGADVIADCSNRPAILALCAKATGEAAA